MTHSAMAPVADTASRPFWSVMIPTCEPDLGLLRQTIESVLASGLPDGDRQIALVDDGTRAPEFEAFAGQLRAAGIEVFRFDDRAGLAGNWNRCIAHARGHWVHILHQDDRVRHGFYAALAKGVAADATIGAAFSQVAFVDVEGRELRTGHMPQRSAGLVHDWIQHIIVNLVVQCPCIVVRRAVYERLGGFDVSFKYCADHDMWQRIAHEYPLWFDPQPLAEYRVHADSATHRDFSLTYRWRERRTCMEAGIEKLSPPGRAYVEKCARRFGLLLAYREFRDLREILLKLASASALLAAGRLSDHVAVWRGHFPQPIPGRATARGTDPRAPRTPRILLVSEFFPADPGRLVFGAFQRLRRHVDSITRVGQLDAVFFSPENHQTSPAECERHRLRIQHAWPIDGELVLLSAASGSHSDGRRRPIRAACWMWRGAASFFHAAPSTRTTGVEQSLLLRDALLRLQPDLIFAHRLGAMGAVIRTNAPLPPVVLDMDDLEHIRLARLALDEREPPKRLRARLRTAIARRVMRVAARRAQVTLVCSEHDRKILTAMAPHANIAIAPNTARDAEPMPPAHGPTAMFVGIATYPPNTEAIRSLVKDIWPRVRRIVPNAHLTIVGDGASTVADSDAAAGIAILDFVPSLGEVYRVSRIALCPIALGGGTRIKIIEAALHGRPIVSSRIGAEGLTFVPGSEILIADDPESFAKLCASLITDPVQCETLGNAARARAKQDYSPERVVRALAELIECHVKQT